MSELVDLQIEDGLAIVTLQRPDAGNALNWPLAAALSEAVSALASDTRTRAVLLKSAGRNFCVGGDIRAFSDAPDPSAFVGRLANSVHESVDKLARLEAPVVVAVQGAAAGAGLSLAVGGDLVVAGRSATFSMAYTAIGLSPDGGASWLLPRLIGLRLTQEMAYANRRLSADEALAHGLATQVVEDEALDEVATGLARKLAQGPTRAFAAVKRLLNEGDRATLSDQLKSEAQSIAASMATQDGQEGFAAFLQRRPAKFTGR